MSITRRQFLLSTAGAAVGAIIPSFYFRALEHLVRAGGPLLEVPSTVSDILYVANYTGDDLQLFLGDPEAEPPPMSHAEYAEYIGFDFEQYMHEWGFSEAEMTASIGCETRYDIWANHDGPSAEAHRLLSALDLGDALTGPDAVGGIELVEESNMVSTWLDARARDEISLSLLQKRLIDLGTGIQIVMR